jgi:hypothetical protein
MIKGFWEAIGGRKFLALLLACGVYLYKGTFDWNLTIIFLGFMGLNVLSKYVGENRPEAKKK